MAFNPQDHIILLKNKPYLPAKYRLVWANQDVENINIDTHFVEHEFGKHVIVRAVVTLGRGENVKSATAHKAQSKASFADYIEKAETGAVSRALGMLGYGTEFTDDFDETDEAGVVYPVDSAPAAKPEPAKKIGDGKPPLAGATLKAQVLSEKPKVIEPAHEDAPEGAASLSTASRVMAGFEAIAALGKVGMVTLNTTRYVAIDGSSHQLMKLRDNGLEEWQDDEAENAALLKLVGDTYRTAKAKVSK